MHIIVWYDWSYCNMHPPEFCLLFWLVGAYCRITKSRNIVDSSCPILQQHCGYAKTTEKERHYVMHGRPEKTFPGEQFFLKNVLQQKGCFLLFFKNIYLKKHQFCKFSKSRGSKCPPLPPPLPRTPMTSYCDWWPGMEAAIRKY